MPIEISDLLVALLPRLVRYARVLTKSPEIADDLVQSACERALAAEHGPGAGVPFDAWMFRITRNLWIDQCRRQKIEGTPEDVDEQVDLAATSGSAADAAGDRMLLDRVHACLDELPDEQREVLLLVCGEDKSYRETAELLGVPIGTVMSRLARARGKLAVLTGVAAQAAEGGGEVKGEVKGINTRLARSR
jgi:RNA polymerase sigma-70 factor (ECF subfamily)